MKKLGDFTGLSDNYSKYRPDYSDSILEMTLALIEKEKHEIDFVDVGAGTGIWTRMVHAKGLNSTSAVEPNLEMRSFGKLQSPDISWSEGSAENTNLKSDSADWLSMASSFHWTEPKRSLPEFSRILRQGGIFTALWNPRIIKGNTMLEEIESYIYFLNPSIKRISSGLSGITNNLEAIILESGCFENVCYSEASHTIKMTHERYIGAWNSVNDLQVQLGSEDFPKFIKFIENTINQVDLIETKYLTRSWSARVKK